MIVGFIDEHKHRTDGGLRWGVESICTVLTQHEVPIAPSTYYDARKRRPSARQLSDDRWKPIVLACFTRQRRVLGARKLWLRLRREGHDIARCTVERDLERLMRELGIVGVRRGKRTNPVDTDARETRPADLVDRHFARFRTDQLWVADFTYVLPWSGWVYVAFVFDAHFHRILGWRAATRMTTPLVLDCLEMAFWTRRRDGVADFTGLTHHTDAGSVYTSIAFTGRLIDGGIDTSVGSVGDAYDNSMAESQIGLLKSELIHHEGPWRNVDQVEAATADWVHWFNTERIHSSIDDLPPVQLEQLDYAVIGSIDGVGQHQQFDAQARSESPRRVRADPVLFAASILDKGWASSWGAFATRVLIPSSSFLGILVHARLKDGANPRPSQSPQCAFDHQCAMLLAIRSPSSPNSARSSAGWPDSPYRS